MKGQWIDLHTHSTASDGSDRPAELMEKAARAGLAAVALTDHDTVAGLDEAEEAGRRLGVRLVRGCELAVQDPEGELHLLGLFLPRESSELRTALAWMQDKRDKRNAAMLEALSQMGLPVSMEEAAAKSGGGSLGRPHIAQIMCAKGYVSNMREAFERYLGWGRSAFVPRTLLTPEEGVSLLSRIGATVVLAHPCLSPAMTSERLDSLLETLRPCGLSAIEAYHSAHDNTAVRRCVTAADRHGLLLSGGSDYHGQNKRGIFLGSGKGNVRVPVYFLEKLLAHRTGLGLDTE